jgi:hypothetical protein
MQRREVSPARAIVLASLVLVALFVLSATAQAAGTPQSYSLTSTNSMLAPNMTIAIARDGSRELVEQVVPKSATSPQGFHALLLYDFAAGKVYAGSPDGGPCTVTNYVSPEVPAPMDPVQAAAEITKQLATQNVSALPTAVVNGIPTRVLDRPVEGGGTMRYWLESQFNVPVKMVLVGPDRRERTLLEVHALRFEKPPAHLLVAPTYCKVVSGQTSATGGHVEMTVKAPPAQGPAPQAPPTAAAPAPESAPQVTAVRLLGVRPTPRYVGPYPGKFNFVFAITSSGHTEVKWVLVNQADVAWENGSLRFESAGTKELSIPIKVGLQGKLWEGWARLLVYEPNRMESEQAPYSVDCRGR